MTSIGANLQQGLSRGFEEKVVEEFGIAEDQRAERVGKREHHVEMLHGKNAGEGTINPLGSFTPLAFGAVAIATGVVGNVQREFAGWADIEMAPKAGGAAGTEAKQDLALPKGSPVLSDVSIPMLLDHIRDFKTITPGIHGLMIGIPDSKPIEINKRLNVAGYRVAVSSNERS